MVIMENYGRNSDRQDSIVAKFNCKILESGISDLCSSTVQSTDFSSYGCLNHLIYFKLREESEVVFIAGKERSSQTEDQGSSLVLCGINDKIEINKVIYSNTSYNGGVEFFPHKPYGHCPLSALTRVPSALLTSQSASDYTR